MVMFSKSSKSQNPQVSEQGSYVQILKLWCFLQKTSVFTISLNG